MSSSKRKVLYLSGTRADFGLMRSTLEQIAAIESVELSIAVTGMHLHADFGETVTEIEACGFRIAARIETEHQTGNGAEMARAIADTVVGMTDLLEREQPDVLLLLGDRGEMLAGALAAAHLNIHVAHIHGGEVSGTIDEMLRHCISKLAHIHFVATERSALVLRRMGENSESITVTGAPGIDDITKITLPKRSTVAEAHGFDPDKPIALALFHPVVQNANQAGDQMRALLGAAIETGSQILVLKPNADSGNRAILKAIEEFTDCPQIKCVTHLKRKDFLAVMARADVMLGNSSSGIIEAASFGTPVVNVGNRQNLRERNLNVLDCGVSFAEINASVTRALEHGRFEPGNIYGGGSAGREIASILQNIRLAPQMLNKVLCYDL